MKAASPDTDLPTLFSTTPLILRHSPLDPTCPARIALSVEKSKQASELREKRAKTPANPLAVSTESTDAEQPPGAATGADDEENIEMVVAQ